MFALPEILWSPVGNFLYTFWKGGNIPAILRNNFLLAPDYRWLLIPVILIQVIGALMGAIFVFRTSVKILPKVILFLVFFILFALSFLVFVPLMMTVNMRIF